MGLPIGGSQLWDSLYITDVQSVTVNGSTCFSLPHNGQSVAGLHLTGVGGEGGSADYAGAVEHTQPTQPLARCG